MLVRWKQLCSLAVLSSVSRHFNSFQSYRDSSSYPKSHTKPGRVTICTINWKISCTEAESHYFSDERHCMQLCSEYNTPTLGGLGLSAIDFSPNVSPAWNSHFSHQAHSAQNERKREIVGWKQASKQQQPLLTLFLPTFTQTGAVLVAAYANRGKFRKSW